jgi:class 3 adenylate cyclase
MLLADFIAVNKEKVIERWKAAARDRLGLTFEISELVNDLPLFLDDLVAAVAADTAQVTAMTERLDPEDVHEIVRRGFEVITTEIHRFEGTINQYGGDGLMALFGGSI